MIFNEALSDGQIVSIYNNHDAGLGWDGQARTCPNLGAGGFVVSHDGAGIHCAAEQVIVRAIDSGGAVLTSYNQEINLDTGTGSGSWRLITGNGSLVDATADDGQARYTFVSADAGEVVLALDYPNGNPLVDVDVYQVSDANITDGDTEGALVFAPTGFTVTASALSNPPPSAINDPIATQTAGTNFAVHLAAYGQDPTDASCGIIESYQGNKSLQAWQSLTDPATGTVLATIGGAQVGSVEASATSHTVSFSAGQAVLTAKYKDAGALRLHVKDISGPTEVRGSTNEFVSRPADLAIVAVETVGGATNPGATSMTGSQFVRAAESFVVVVDALDAEGARTPNFGREAAAETITVASAGLLLPVGGRNGIADDGMLAGGTAFAPTGPAGRFQNSVVQFDDIGVISLQASVTDGSYLGTGPVTGTATGNVGRFYVDEFVLSGPQLAGACTNFTYMDQPGITLGFALNAHNAAGVTVTNYDTALLGANVADVLLAAEDSDDGINLASRLSTDTATTAWQQGSFVVNQNDALFAKLATFDGGYTALDVGVGVVDNIDGRVLAGRDMQAAASGNCLAGGTCTEQRLGTTEIYYGRLVVLPALGPENANLAVTAQAEIYQGSGFVPFLQDSCSTYVGSGLALSGYAGNLQSGETNVLGPAAAVTLLNGQTQTAQPALLSAPGFGNDGEVQVEFATDNWLRFPWSGAGLQNPTNAARFGSYRGHDRIVYWAEDP